MNCVLTILVLLPILVPACILAWYGFPKDDGGIT